MILKKDRIDLLLFFAYDHLLPNANVFLLVVSTLHFSTQSSEDLDLLVGYLFRSIVEKLKEKEEGAAVDSYS